MKETMDEIIRDVTIVYSNGTSECFEAIQFTKNGVVIFRVVNGKFITYGFVLKRNIKEIWNGGRLKVIYEEKLDKEEDFIYGNNILNEGKIEGGKK